MSEAVEETATGNEKILTIKEQGAMLDEYLQQSVTQVDNQDSQGEVSQHSEEQISPNTTENNNDTSDPPKAKEKSDSNKTSKKGYKFNADYYKEKGIIDPVALKEIERQERLNHASHVEHGHQSTKLGEARKELEQLSKDKELLQKQAAFSDEEYNELADENPAAAARRANQANNAERDLSEINKRQQELELQGFIKDKVPDYSDYQAQINEIIKKDMDHFGREPTEVEGRIYNFAQRAKLEESHTELQAQVKELNSKLESQPKNILNQINEAAKTPSFGVDSGYSQTDSSTIIGEYGGHNLESLAKVSGVILKD